MDQSRIPLLEALLKHKKHDPISFHVPGHKNGSVFEDKGKAYYEKILSIDLTELSGLDDLHNPSGVIREAERLAAKLYGSTYCHFLVGGSTIGNLAMIMATCKPGDSVLVQRNSHKSIINALKLAKVNPIFLHPDFDHEAQIATCLNENQVIENIEIHSQAKALILTNPNYYGFTVPLQEIISTAHKYQMAVLIDEAHGAHFSHHSKLFPASAVSQGADIVVQSAHKTLPAMTMCSFLHYKSELVSIERLRHYLQLFQSSSPSYPLMSSLDLARHYFAHLTTERVTLTLEKIKEFKEYLQAIPQLKVIESKDYVVDPLKVTVQAKCGITGFELQSLLEEEAIFTELSDTHNVLFVLPLEINIDLVKVAETIKEKLSSYRYLEERNKLEQDTITGKAVSELKLSYEEMDFAPRELVHIEQSVGRIIAEEIIPYPPGVPFLLSGEEITLNDVEKLKELQNSGVYFQGTDFFKRGISVFVT